MSRAQLTSTVEQNTGGAVSPYVAGKNFLINGGFDIWQRATSSSSLGNYTTADRWFLGTYGGTGTFSQEATVIPALSRYSLKFISSSTAQPYAYQAIETANAQQLAGQTVVLSAKLAASTSVPVTISLEYSTSVDNSVLGSWLAITPSSGGTATPTSTTFVTATGVFAVPSTAKSLRVGTVTTGSIANAVTIYIGTIQLELGSVATPFSRAGGTLSGELAACQRYYWRYTATTDAYMQMTTTGTGSSSTLAIIPIQTPVPMRSVPSSIDFSNIRIVDSVNGYAITAVGFSFGGNSSNIPLLNFTVASGLTQFRPYYVSANNSTSAYLGMSAEL